MKHPSEMPVGTIRRTVATIGGKTCENRIIKICGDYSGLNRPISYWGFADRIQTIPTPAEFEAELKADRMVPETYAIWDFSQDAREITPEDEDFTQEVIEFTTLPQRKALKAGRRVFLIKPNGDPFSKAWQATEAAITGFIYQGDAPNLGKGRLKAWLQRTYPGCLVGIDS